MRKYTVHQSGEMTEDGQFCTVCGKKLLESDGNPWRVGQPIAHDEIEKHWVNTAVTDDPDVLNNSTPCTA